MLPGPRHGGGRWMQGQTDGTNAAHVAYAAEVVGLFTSRGLVSSVAVLALNPSIELLLLMLQPSTSPSSDVAARLGCARTLVVLLGHGIWCFCSQGLSPTTMTLFLVLGDDDSVPVSTGATCSVAGTMTFYLRLSLANELEGRP
jgi:hypothetical protein